MKQRRDRTELEASVVHVELFLHPRPVNNIFNVQKDCKYRFVYGHHGGAVILRPIDFAGRAQKSPERRASGITLL